MKYLLFLFFITSGFALQAQGVIPETEKGKALKDFYLGLDVEHLWLSGQHVNWETGRPDNPDAEQDIHTHCSAFVAAACKRLNIYILRPPEHSMQLLANAQYDWLASPQAQAAGWKPLLEENTYEKAQELANRGYVVVAAFKNKDPRLPGHIALVRPAEISPDQVKGSGPMLIMASTHNFNYISLRAGFKSHITEWPDQAIHFYYHAGR